MARRKEQPQSPTPAPIDGSSRDGAAVHGGQVLVVMGGGASRTKVDAMLREVHLRADFVAGVDEARRALVAHDYDVLLIDLDHSRGIEAGGEASRLMREQAMSGRAARVIAACKKPDVETAVSAMRLGAGDLIRMPFDKVELQERVLVAAEHAARARRAARRVERLKRLCKRLQAAQERVSEQVDGLYDDMSVPAKTAPPPARAKGQTAPPQSIAAEYGGLIRRELDVEQLLRTTLEYLLTKSGPTNAAVFLPSGSDDYSLGAYVNYDMPKDAVDVLLDHLADVVPGKYAREKAIVRLRSDAEIRDALGEGLGWLGGADMMIFRCVCKGETLAVAALFRDSSKPFAAELTAALESLRSLFAEQLSRVINIHNRHMPAASKEEWLEGDERDEDEWGLAA